MRQLLVALLLCLPLAGCEGDFGQGIFVTPAVNKERPIVNPPLKDRQKNWVGNQREGSCVWASTITLLRWQGRYNTAERIRRKYGNGEWPDDWAKKMEKEGLRYVTWSFLSELVALDEVQPLLSWAERTW